jgi:hypothetical protein
LINIEFLTFEESKEKGRKIFNDIVKRKEILNGSIIIFI